MKYIVKSNNGVMYEKDFSSNDEVANFVDKLYAQVIYEFNQKVLEQVNKTVKECNNECVTVILGMPDTILPNQQFIISDGKENEALKRFSRITNRHMSQHNNDYEISVFAPALLAEVISKDKEPIEIPFIKERRLITITKKTTIKII